MISQMAAVDIANTNEADVVLTDSDNAHAGPYLVLVDPVSLRSTMNGVDKGAGIYVLEAAIRLVAHGLPDQRSSDQTFSFLGLGLRRLNSRHRRTAYPARAPGPAETGRGCIEQDYREDLEISHATAKFHVSSLLTKLGARNRTDAVAIGLKFGLLLL